MIEAPTDYADLQYRWCNTQAPASLEGARIRATRVRDWIAQSPVRPMVELGSVLCVGPRWGDEMERFLELGADDVVGIEVVPEFAAVCQGKGLLVLRGTVEETVLLDSEWNVFCSHVLEHCFDRDKAIEVLQAACRDWFYVDSPIEPGEVKDKAHYSPFRSVDELMGYFPEHSWKIAMEDITGPNQRGNYNASVLFVKRGSDAD